MSINKPCESKFFIVLATVTLLVIGMSIICPIPCDADIASTYYFDDGVTFHNGTDLHMPEANVSIVYHHNATGDLLSISCDFEIYTNTTQNTTLAFAYPNTWLWDDFHNESLAMFIYHNGTPLNFTTYSWERFGWNSSDYNEVGIESNWLDITLFSVFNLELFNDTTTLISVEVTLLDVPKANFFHLSYIVSSARTFESDTHQRIQVKVIEEQPIIDMDFTPDDFLSIQKDGIITDAYWEFNVSEFEYDMIRFCLYINAKYNMYPTTPTTSTTSTTSTTNTTTATPFILDMMFITTVGITAVIVVGLVLIIRDYKR